MITSNQYKNFRDPLHGFIEVTAAELRIVDHPLFQRLRDICQLAFSKLVFPGGNHSRFEHVLGVLHVATVIFDSIFAGDEDRVKYFLLPPKRRIIDSKTYPGKAGKSQSPTTGYPTILHKLRNLNLNGIDDAGCAKILQELKSISLDKDEPDKSGYAKVFEELRSGDFSYFSIYADPDPKVNARRQVRKIIKDAGISIK